MAYVHPSTSSRDLVETLHRYGVRAIALGAYATALVVAVVILAPVLFDGGSSEAAPVATGPAPVLYTAQPGETPGAIAAAHGISSAELYSLNRTLTPLAHGKGAKVVVGLR